MVDARRLIAVPVGDIRECMVATTPASPAPPPFPFGRICFVVLVMRKGGRSSWSGPWHLGCTLEVFQVHSYQDRLDRVYFFVYLV